MDIDTAIDNSKLVQSTLSAFSGYFGGATSSQAKGAWLSSKNSLVIENVTIVYSFATTEQVDQHMGDIVNLAMSIKAEYKQDSIALEYDNQLFLI